MSEILKCIRKRLKENVLLTCGYDTIFYFLIRGLCLNIIYTNIIVIKISKRVSILVSIILILKSNLQCLSLITIEINNLYMNTLKTGAVHASKIWIKIFADHRATKNIM